MNDILILMGQCLSSVQATTKGEIQGNILKLHNEDIIRKIQASLRMYNARQLIKQDNYNKGGFKDITEKGLTSENEKVKVCNYIGN